MTSFILGFLIALLYESFMRRLFGGKGLIVRGWKLHHSLYGVLSILLSFINRKIFFFGFGVGVIAQHTFFEGFWFITKESVQ
jgi:hypothetical protein